MLHNSISLKFDFAFYCLFAFLVSRPLLTSLEKYFPIPIHIIIPLIFTYALVIFLFLNIKYVKLDTINFLILIFVTYLIISALWGSKYTNIIRVASPFIAFISVRTFADNYYKIRAIFWSLFVAYLPGIILSAVLIFLGKSIENVNYYTGLSRQEGVFYNAHALSHIMIFFSFIALYLFFEKSNMRSFARWKIFLALSLSLYNIYNSYVRSGYLAIVVFWSIFLFFWRKNFFLFFLFIAILVATINYNKISIIFWQTDRYTIDDASSGRITIWKHNIDLFIKQDFHKKMIGWGLIDYDRVIGATDFPASSHNDYLQLLMEGGVIGLILYLFIIFRAFYDVLQIQDNNKKYIFLSALITFVFISIVTNGWVYRIENGQLFWSYLGAAYNFRGTLPET